MIELTLPYPPSINHYYGNRPNGGKFIKPKGRKFRRDVGFLVKHLKLDVNLTERLSLTLNVFPPDNRKRDIDNIFKAFLDSLTHANVYKDDSQIKQLHVNWNDPCENGKLDVSIEVAD